MNFNLDDLNPSQSSPTAQPTNLVSGDDLGLQRGGASLEDIYDRHMKMIYVIDISGSMHDGIVDPSSVSDYKWTPEVLQAIEDRIANAVLRAEEEGSAFLGGDDEDDEAADPFESLKDLPGLVKLEHEDPLNDLFWLGLKDAPTETRKAHIVQQDAWQEIGLDCRAQKKMTPKIDAVRKLSTRMVEERYAKHPTADVHLILFAGNATYRKPAGKQDLLDQLSQLRADGGSTDVCNGIRKAIALCKKSPSPVHSHHIVLVTDGLDFGIGSLPELLPQMQELNLVLDVIHVTSMHEVSCSEYQGKILEEVCSATKGAFRRVARLCDFESRFLEAARRLCLPAPAAK